jgi:hypothetical protein
VIAGWLACREEAGGVYMSLPFFSLPHVLVCLSGVMQTNRKLDMRLLLHDIVVVRELATEWTLAISLKTSVLWIRGKDLVCTVLTHPRGSVIKYFLF